MSDTGVLNVNKPPGWTSFKVVASVRRLSGQRRVGHAGTLDPQATGVLLILLGQAARISQYLMDLPKTYRAEVKLGFATDTYDATGRLTAEADFNAVTEAQVREALAEFVGEVLQVPPAYSAVKRAGTPAHRYARAGRPLTLAPRKAVIYRIDLLGFEPPLVALEVECGKGTYIRTLAHDLGLTLGCGAHLHSLERTRIGPFPIEDAVPIEELEAGQESGRWREHLIPMDFGLGQMPSVVLDMEEEKDVRHGCAIFADRPAFERLKDAEAAGRARAYGEDGRFVAVMRFDAAAPLWRPEKVFPPA
ncbi:MAG: tRNA pseudouridine(55) synthase TruB [Chloroflexi bacterium]|nr:tRNA pseudouridine(55) synthase TruB [Chloroflexota bacterium]